MAGRRGRLYPLVRPALFALDPERAHRLALAALRTAGLLPSYAGKRLSSYHRPVELLGLRFHNRVGLAAGFDKNGVAVDGLGRLGFGFIEIGTVTPRAQPGQAQLRLFRAPRQDALVNRLGFPNDGTAACALRLRQRRYQGVLGVNIGKNADTPLERATDDYLAALRAVHEVADYVAINISSPNTVALRELHARERLQPLLECLLRERESLVRSRGHALPLLLKLSPDLATTALRQVATTARELGLDGLIATNTTVQRPYAIDTSLEAGGLSGRPLHRLALETVVRLREALGGGFPVIGVGGIDSPEAALAMRRAGADLVQLYTGLIYRGPGLITDCVRALH